MYEKHQHICRWFKILYTVNHRLLPQNTARQTSFLSSWIRERQRITAPVHHTKLQLHLDCNHHRVPGSHLLLVAAFCTASCRREREITAASVCECVLLGERKRRRAQRWTERTFRLSPTPHNNSSEVLLPSLHNPKLTLLRHPSPMCVFCSQTAVSFLFLCSWF
jgi:hypothetical protein